LSIFAPRTYPDHFCINSKKLILTFDPFSIDLPVTEIIPETRQQLEDNNTLLVNAPPGAGKSTLLPLALMHEPWLHGKKIVMLEPRRLAARTIASRMAELLGEEVGQTIGYRIRFDKKVSANTRIEVLTEGILTRMLQTDNELQDVGLVIFDEFHERSLFADVALALCRESQQVLRPDLRILIMSATLNMPQLTKLLNAPVVVSEGRQHPVEIKYTGERDEFLLPELTARTVLNAVREQQGDTLVFLPGEGEIRKCEDLLKKQLPDFVVHPLYGQLPQGKQYSAILPNRQGKRKIVLATSIAETSLTIEGIKVVVDTGYGRTSRFDVATGLSRLETIEISKDMADQRAGRAGRLSAGICYRMWTPATQHRMPEHRTPEIVEADLTSLVLDMAHWGVNDIQQLTWLTPPPKSALNQGTELLHQLEALENGRITEHGKRVLKLPCHPRIAHMLLMAEDDDQTALATDLAAILEERDPLNREAGIDINLRIEALRRHRRNGKLPKKFKRIEKIAASYRKLFQVKVDNTEVDPYETGIILVHAYPERIAHARPGNNAQFQLSNGSYAAAGHRDDLAHESWLAVAHVNARDGQGKIFLASPLNPKDLAPLVKSRKVITWDTRRGGLIATEDLRIGCIVLQSKPLPTPDESHRVKAISEAIRKEGEQLLNFDQELQQWQNRVLSLRKWNPDQGWPDVSTPALLMTNEEWLAPYLTDVKKPEDLKKINLTDVLHHHLSWEKQEALNQLAPQRIEVPSGSKVKVAYQANGQQPVLAVRLQELFGQTDTPRVNDGKTPVLLHLLSPGFKPIQVTSDLASFWETMYFEVKKELRIKYAKHAWPDDPLAAEPMRGAKKRRR
jgi:ATP-dependent helicase HrpB